MRIIGMRSRGIQRSLAENDTGFLTDTDQEACETDLQENGIIMKLPASGGEFRTSGDSHQDYTFAAGSRACLIERPMRFFFSSTLRTTT